MAFMSEIRCRSIIAPKAGARDAIEISLSPADMARIGDFVVAAHHSNGALQSSVALSALHGQRDAATGLTVFRIVMPLKDVLHAHETVGITLFDRGSAVGLCRVGNGTGRQVGPCDAGETRQVADPPPNGLAGGSFIATPQGERQIETLRVGDLVTTLDGGDQPIRMINAQRLTRPDLCGNRALLPVGIAAGALGFGLPRRNLRVGQQHRMLIRHIRIPLMFGEDAVFVRAKSLAASFEGVSVDSSCKDLITYQLVFDRHEVIFAEGSPTESFQRAPDRVPSTDRIAQSNAQALLPLPGTAHDAQVSDYLTLRSWELMAMVS